MRLEADPKSVKFADSHTDGSDWEAVVLALRLAGAFSVTRSVRSLLRDVQPTEARGTPQQADSVRQVELGALSEAGATKD